MVCQVHRPSNHQRRAHATTAQATTTTATTTTATGRPIFVRAELEPRAILAGSRRRGSARLLAEAAQQTNGADDDEDDPLHTGIARIICLTKSQLCCVQAPAIGRRSLTCAHRSVDLCPFVHYRRPGRQIFSVRLPVMEIRTPPTGDDDNVGCGRAKGECKGAAPAAPSRRR